MVTLRIYYFSILVHWKKWKNLSNQHRSSTVDLKMCQKSNFTSSETSKCKHFLTQTYFFCIFKDIFWWLQQHLVHSFLKNSWTFKTKSREEYKNLPYKADLNQFIWPKNSFGMPNMVVERATTHAFDTHLKVS